MAVRIISGFDQREPKQLPHELVAEPLTAWRIWTVHRTGGALSVSDLDDMAEAWDRGENPFRSLTGYRLGSVGVSGVWTRQMRASCTRGHHAKGSPQSGCQCGVWALKTREDAEEALAEYWRGDRDCSFALGAVQLWGRIIECERGYRAEFARPVHVDVYAPPDVSESIAGRYGCSAASVETPKGLFGAKSTTLSFREALNLVDATKFPLTCLAARAEKPAVNLKVEWLIEQPDGSLKAEFNNQQIMRVPFSPKTKTPNEALEELLSDVEKTIEFGHRNAHSEGSLAGVRTCGGFRSFLGRGLRPGDELELRPLRGPTFFDRGWSGMEWICEFSLIVREGSNNKT